MTNDPKRYSLKQKDVFQIILFSLPEWQGRHLCFEESFVNFPLTSNHCPSKPPEAHIGEPEKCLCVCGHPRANLPLGNRLQLGLNDIPLLWKLREFCYSQILGLCREQSRRDGTPLFRSRGQQQLCPHGADLPYLTASWDVLFLCVWLISVGCFQHLWCKDGCTIWKSWAKAGLPRGTPYLSFSELDSTCLPITAYTVEPVLHRRVRSLMSDNMKEHEGNAWPTNHALYLVKMTGINSQWIVENLKANSQWASPGPRSQLLEIVKPPY